MLLKDRNMKVSQQECQYVMNHRTKRKLQIGTTDRKFVMS